MEMQTEFTMAGDTVVLLKNADDKDDLPADAQNRKHRRSFCYLAIAFAVTVAAMLLLFVLLWMLLPRTPASPEVSRTASHEVSRTASHEVSRTAASPIAARAAASPIASRTATLPVVLRTAAPPIAPRIEASTANPRTAAQTASPRTLAIENLRSPAAPTPPSVCSSEACISATALLLRSVDRSADPCEDFFSFACGGIERNYPFTDKTMINMLGVTPDEEEKLNGKVFELFIRPELVWSPDPDMSRLHQAARDMFLSCVAWHDPKTWWLPTELKASRQEAERPPRDLAVLQQALIREIDKPADLEGFLAMLVRTQTSGLLRLVPVDAIISAEMGQRRPFLSLDAMQFGMSPWSEAVSSELTELCSLLGISGTVPTSLVVKTQRNYCINSEENASTFSLLQLQTETDRLFSNSSSFSWIRFIKSLHAEDNVLEANISIRIRHFHELVKVLKLLSPEFASRKGALFDFLRVDAAMSLRNFLPMEKFPALIASYTADKYLLDREENSTSKEDVPKFCMSLPVASMNPVVYDMFKRAYVRDNFSLVHSLISDIKHAMKLNANEEPWIRQPSKQAITDKIRDIMSIVGHFELPASQVKSIFYPIVPNSQNAHNFGDIVLMHKLAETRLQLWLQTSSVELHNAFNALYNPMEVNAIYVPKLNSINILTGILGTFLYNRDYPDYLMYGGMGWVIGHELAHAFGIVTNQVEGEAEIRPMTIFDPRTLDLYRNKTACLINSYDRHHKQEMNILSRLFGQSTIEEDFADIVGLNAAFRAYKNRQTRSGKAPQLLPGPLGSALTPDQLFFVQTAQFSCMKMRSEVLRLTSLLDSHSPPRSRVLGSMMHSKDFSRVFRCRPGNKMYLKDSEKCQFW